MSPAIDRRVRVFMWAWGVIAYAAGVVRATNRIAGTVLLFVAFGCWFYGRLCVSLAAKRAAPAD